MKSPQAFICLLVVFCCGLSFVNGQNLFDQSYPLNSSNLLFSTKSMASIGMKFEGQDIGGSLIMKQYVDEEMNLYKKYPIVNVTGESELTLMGVYSLNLTNASYQANDTFFLYLSYFVGVFNSPPETLNLLLLDNSNRFVSLPNEKRERFDVKTVNATFSMYENMIQNNMLYMGVFGQIIIQHSVMDTYVNISYPQIVNYELNSTLNQTLDVYYYDWYGSIIGGIPYRYMMINVNDQITYPNSSFISLYKFKIVGAPDQDRKQPFYNGYGLRNYVFYFNLDSLLDYYSKQFNETLKIETLACGYQEKGTDFYIDNGRSHVDVKEGTLSCDDTLGDKVQSVTLMIRTNNNQPPSPQPSTSNNPPVDHTTVIAVTASVFGVLLLGIGIVTFVALICCIRRSKKYTSIH